MKKNFYNQRQPAKVFPAIGDLLNLLQMQVTFKGFRATGFADHMCYARVLPALENL